MRDRNLLENILRFSQKCLFLFLFHIFVFCQSMMFGVLDAPFSVNQSGEAGLHVF